MASKYRLNIFVLCLVMLGMFFCSPIFAAIPTFVQEQEILSNDGKANDFFGWSVAVSDDTLLVGAVDAGDVGQGAAYLYQFQNGTWQQIQELSPGVSGDFFGNALSIDNTSLAVSATGAGTAGLVYVYQNANGTWDLSQVVTPNNTASGLVFGYTLALHGDTLIVGAPGFQSNQGAVYVFTRNNGTWIQNQQIVADDGVDGDGNGFGSALAFSGDTLVVSSPNFNLAQGAVYVFDLINGTWVQSQKIVGETVGIIFGESVSIDGTTFIVGAPLGQVDGNTLGVVYVFQKSGDSWIQSQKLAANNGAMFDQLGFFVAMEGDVIVAAAPSADVQAPPLNGAVYVFVNEDGTFVQTQELVGLPGSANDAFGTALAMHHGKIMVGAQTTNVSSQDFQGSAFLFNAAQVIVDPQSISLLAGDSASYTLVLNAPPQGDVVITPSASSSDLSFVSSPITFTASNWYIPQTVSFTTLPETEGEMITISHTASSGDMAYNQISISNVSVALISSGHVSGGGCGLRQSNSDSQGFTDFIFLCIGFHLLLHRLMIRQQA